MKTLIRLLNVTFKPGRAPDPFRKPRAEAKRLAAEAGVDIESLRPEYAGSNVWPPKGLEPPNDPYAGDHYADDWNEVLVMVRRYHDQVTAGKPLDKLKGNL